jgi:hypothetical protein
MPSLPQRLEGLEAFLLKLRFGPTITRLAQRPADTREQRIAHLFTSLLRQHTSQ